MPGQHPRELFRSDNFDTLHCAFHRVCVGTDEYPDHLHPAPVGDAEVNASKKGSFFKRGYGPLGGY